MRKGLIILFVSLASGVAVLFVAYLVFRKPQTSLTQAENLSLTITPLASADMTELFGNDFFIAPGLVFIQGLELSSRNPHFGGWSGIAVTKNDSRLSAVSDTGHWLEADLLTDHGQITAMNAARIGPLRNTRGNTLRESGYGDIEAIGMDDNRFYLAFESYRSGIWSAPRRASLEHTGFERWPSPAEMTRLPVGRGLEALAVIDGADENSSRLLAIAERNYGKVGARTPAWIFKTDRQAEAFFYIPLTDGYDVSDAAFHPQCGLFLLQRKLTGFGRFYVRLLKLEPRLSGAWTNAVQQRLFEASSAGRAIDNMEGLAVTRDPAGECRLYLLSDSNFLPIQKTVLLKFGYRS
ncbi:esterase-like activity of phytase family protein [Methylomonas methanica]|uniref:Phytase-like domain-containing protein n=1 Tax=Methylomonas methanica (strain DSM 25384 / MC09) TaxID=857087 RepID=G0A3H3_METMM|nr:esterase-like activity of phytase family protein [Methylomonas methanica]AEG00272.1 hypothetical protein Metme_1856 [Methylomonas methanica MC09]